MSRPSNGGLTVTGNGVAQSGGLIRRKSGADGSLAGGIGIYLNNTKDSSFRYMQLASFQNAAIRGQGVVGFRLEDSIIDGTNGTAAATGEGSVVFGPPAGGGNGLLGTAVIRSSQILGSVEHNLAIYNESGALTLQMDGVDGAFPPTCWIQDNSLTTGQDGMLLHLRGTATGTVTIDSCRFRNNRGNGLRALAEDDAVLSVSVDQADIVGSTQGNRGVVVSNSNNAQLTLVVNNSTFDSLDDANVWVGQAAGNASALSMLRATITANDMTQEVGATSPTIVARLSSTVGEAAPARLLIDNNVIRTPLLEGIHLSTPDASTTPAVDLTLTNNHVDLLDPAGPHSVTIEATQSGANLCANIGMAPLGHSGFVGNLFHVLPTAGVGGPVRIGQENGATFRLERGVSAISATPLEVLEANDSPDGPTLYDIVGTPTVVETGVCLLPTTP